MSRKVLVAAVVLIAFAASKEAILSQEGSQSLRRSLTVEQAAIYDTRPADSTGGLRVKLWADRPDYTYAVGENVQLFVESNQDAYVTLLSTDPAGNTTVLFPNSHQSSNFVRAARAVAVPDPAAPIKVVVRSPVGIELLKVLASSTPFSVQEALDLRDTGSFQTVRTSAVSTARSLSVIMADGDSPDSSAGPAPGGAGGGGLTSSPNDEWTICHQVVKTVPAPTTEVARLSRSLTVEERRSEASGGAVRCEEF